MASLTDSLEAVVGTQVTRLKQWRASLPQPFVVSSIAVHDRRARGEFMKAVCRRPTAPQGLTWD
jgi:hypothetical protein